MTFELMRRIYIVEDQEEIRKGLVYLINLNGEFDCRGFGSAEEALKNIETDRPEVVLMDINLGGMNGIECTKRIKELYPEIHVMMVTVYEDDEKIFNALAAGASGYVLKKAPLSDLCNSINDLLNGGSPMSSQIARKVVETFRVQQITDTSEDGLSRREAEILDLLAQGFRNKEIASKLFLSAYTVKAHIYNIYQKLHVRNRVEAMNKIKGRT